MLRDGTGRAPVLGVAATSRRAAAQHKVTVRQRNPDRLIAHFVIVSKGLLSLILRHHHEDGQVQRLPLLYRMTRDVPVRELEEHRNH